jgi:DNA polymerase I
MSSARMKLLLVDGTNIVMRCAFGGDVPAERACPIAAGMIARAVSELGATHMIIAFDSAGETFRHRLAPDYKAQRTVSSQPWVLAAGELFERNGWFVTAQIGFEADDLIATLAARARERGNSVDILTGDSDALALIDDDVTVWRPASGRTFERWDAARVFTKYGVRPDQMLDLKALTGESGENIKGVPGIGPKKAAALLAAHGSLDRLLARTVPDTSGEAAKVAVTYREVVILARRLTELRTDVPIDPISPASCRVPTDPVNA